MADNYTNPVDSKLTDYANRMRQLINEAYAEGIVLTTSNANNDIRGLPSGQQVRRMVVGVPIVDHVHQQMQQPETVTAAAMTVRNERDLSEQIVPPIKLPPRRMTKVVPIRRPESEWCFVDPAVVKPWAIREGGPETSVLRFNARFDILGLSHDDELAARGEIQLGDVLDPYCLVEKLYYYSANGSLEVVDLTSQALNQFAPTTSGDYATVELDLPVRVALEGGPATSSTSVHDVTIIQLQGQVNLRYGVVQLDAIANNPNIRPMGYTLLMNRTSSNRS